ncbi:MAG TPA: VOC family protein, partial [Thermoanaerobaculia bacterium]
RVRRGEQYLGGNEPERSRPMPQPPERPLANVAHFAINADDVPRARRFYERVFGWGFEAWGPPGFLILAKAGDRPPAVLGALQKRRELIEGQRTVGFECTVAVADVDAVAAAVVANGGTILIPRTLIPTVGHLIFFRDPEGNAVGAMQYDAGAVDEI